MWLPTAKARETEEDKESKERERGRKREKGEELVVMRICNMHSNFKLN